MAWLREDQIFNSAFNPNTGTLNVIVSTQSQQIPNHWYREDEVLNYTFDKDLGALRVNIIGGGGGGSSIPYYRDDIYINTTTNTVTVNNVNNGITEAYVFVNGLLQTENIDYTINNTTGTITFNYNLNDDYVSIIYKSVSN